MELTSLLGAIIVASAAAIMLGRYKGEYAFLIGIAAGTGVFLYLLGLLTDSFFTLRNIVEEAGLDTKYFLVILNRTIKYFSSNTLVFVRSNVLLVVYSDVAQTTFVIRHLLLVEANAFFYKKH